MQLYFGEHSLKKILLGSVAYVMRRLAFMLTAILLLLFLQSPSAYAEENSLVSNEARENIQEEPSGKDGSDKKADNSAEDITALTENNETNKDSDSKKDIDTNKNAAAQESTVTIGDSESKTKVPTKEEEPEKNTKPSIKEATVLGNFDTHKKGVDYFRHITISIVGENLTDANFLTKEGLHWSDKTTVEPIKAKELGTYDFSNFTGTIPHAKVKTYSNNNGDSGRITYVGKTKSGIDLDLIWTIISSDKKDWAAHSGYNDHRIKGLGFIGEQYFSGAKGNSIVVLYNNASSLGIKYQIVQHATNKEQPVVVSFISTDIDSAQGVKTDLANIVEIIPKDSHLVKKKGVIYDTTRGVVNLNGSADLPQGGYLGAGFLSHFNYIFYSPAPARAHNSYAYPTAVRYDIFGSSLQAKLQTKINQHIIVQYVDTAGKDIKPKEFYKGFRDESYRISSLSIPKYQLVDIKKDESDSNRPIITFVYAPEYRVKFSFVDEAGKRLTEEKQYFLLEGRALSYDPPAIQGYMAPSNYSGIVTSDLEYAFVYKKIVPLTPEHKGTGKSTTQHSGKKPINNNTLYPEHTAHVVISHSSHTNSTTTAPTKPASHKAAIDPFLINTNMTAEEKKQFLDYIDEVARQAKKKYGKDKDKINHAIANAIAYPVYATDTLQSLTNDFGKKPKVENYRTIRGLLRHIHKKSYYKIDFPHLATTLATAEDSGTTKEILKWFAGLSLSNLLGHSPKDNFFQLNSLTGDTLTNIDAKDRRTDIDAIIFHYHPDFKNLTLDECIKNYYHTENLDVERDRLYQEVLALQSDKHATAETQERTNILAATLSLGGIALILLALKNNSQKEFKKFTDNPVAYIKGILSNIGPGIITIATTPLTSIGAALGVLSNLFADIAVFGAKKVFSLANTLYLHVLKPAATSIGKHILQPIGKFLVQPAYTKLIKPALSAVEKKLLRPVVQKVVKPAAKFVQEKIIKPIKNKVVKPITTFVSNKIIKPISEKVIKPVAKFVHHKLIKPVYRKVIKPLYNKVIKPAVKPFYHKVIRPAARFIKKNVIQPTARFVKNYITQPIGKFFKRIWN